MVGGGWPLFPFSLSKTRISLFIVKGAHSLAVAFWASSVVLFLLVRHTPPPATLSPKGPGGAALHNCRPWSLAERALVSVAAVALAAAVTWSRVYLGYHTPRQVAVGSAAGILTAVAWFAFTAVLRRAGLICDRHEGRHRGSR